MITKRYPANGSFHIFKESCNTVKCIMRNFLQQSTLGLSFDLTEGEDWGK